LLKIIIANLIAYLPVNAMRIFAYRAVFKYSIQRSYIGIGTIINVEKFQMSDSRIGRFNLFTGPFKVVLKNRSSIGTSNKFICGNWTIDKEYSGSQYQRLLEIGEQSMITSEHFFDVAGSFILGDGSWIAGRGSQFWTHGAGIQDRNIKIGDNCYLGSALRFSPGAEIGNNVLVAMGSVISGKHSSNNVLVGGVPAKIIRENYDWKNQKNIETDNVTE
jgi:acetyltransferase-like isoleucine patch superfamily enzyme